MELTDRRAVETGAGSGLGEAIADWDARHGLRAAVIDEARFG